MAIGRTFVIAAVVFAFLTSFDETYVLLKAWIGDAHLGEGMRILHSSFKLEFGSQFVYFSKLSISSVYIILFGHYVQPS